MRFGPREAAALVLYVAAVVLSTQFALAKRDALAYHTRDYTYYLQFHSRLFEAGREARFTINPNGSNFLGFKGTEGAQGFHQAIHFEPVKYARAAVFATGLGVAGVHLFDALLFFAPVLYLVFRMPLLRAGDRTFYAAVAAAYLLIPSALQSVAFDLRPYSLLLPGYALCILSLGVGRSRGESVAFFVLLLLVREEGLVLGLLAIFYAVASPARDGAVDRRRVRMLGACWAAGWIATLVYLFGSGYAHTASLWSVSSLLLGLFVLGPPLIRGVQRRSADLARWLPSLVLLGVAAPLAFRADEQAGGSALFDPRFALAAGSALLIAVSAWPVLRGSGARNALLVAVFATVAFFAGANLSGHPDSARSLRARYAEQEQAAGIVRALRDRIDPDTSVVLGDYVTHQAFSDFEHAYAYERLPWYLAPGDARFFPANEEPLKQLFRDRVEYVAVARENRGYAEWLEATAGMEGSLEPMASNERYVVMRVVRGPR